MLGVQVVAFPGPVSVHMSGLGDTNHSLMLTRQALLAPETIPVSSETECFSRRDSKDGQRAVARDQSGFTLATQEGLRCRQEPRWPPHGRWKTQLGIKEEHF